MTPNFGFHVNLILWLFLSDLVVRRNRTNSVSYMMTLLQRLLVTRYTIGQLVTSQRHLCLPPETVITTAQEIRSITTTLLHPTKCSWFIQALPCLTLCIKQLSERDVCATNGFYNEGRSGWRLRNCFSSSHTRCKSAEPSCLDRVDRVSVTFNCGYDENSVLQFVNRPTRFPTV